jgi:hypothetical protein
VVQGFSGYVDRAVSVTPLCILQRLLRHSIQVCLFQRFELKNPGTTDQGFVDLKEGILGGRPNQNHRAVFHPGQQRILLGFVEAVNFINKENGAASVLAAKFLGGGDGLGCLSPRPVRH